MTGQRLPRLIAPEKCDIVTAELRKGGSGSAMAGKSEHLKRAAAWILILFTLFFPQRALHEDPEEAKVMEAKQEAVLEKLGIGRD